MQASPEEGAARSRMTSASWATSDAVRKTMQGNRSTDTAPEVRLRAALHRAGLRFFKHRRPEPKLTFRADIVFPAGRLAVFVDGCFWHSCPAHGTRPRANRDWWDAKLAHNRLRDERNDSDLRKAGWQVLRIWEHEPIDLAVGRVKTALDR